MDANSQLMRTNLKMLTVIVRVLNAFPHPHGLTIVSRLFTLKELNEAVSSASWADSRIRYIFPEYLKHADM